MALNVGAISGQLVLDDKGFSSTLNASKQAWAKTMLDMQRSSNVKLDLDQWKQLQNQMKALQSRAQDVRLAFIKATPGTDEAKKLGNELANLTKKCTLLKNAAEPTRKELERLARSEKEASVAAKVSGGGSGKSAFEQVSGQVTGALPGGLGAVASAASEGPYAAAAAAAIAATAGIGAGMLKAGEAAGSYAGQMKNLSAETNLSTTRLQELKYISESNGLSFETVTTSVTMLEKNLQGLEDDTGVAAKAADKLGVSVKDSSGNLRSMDAIFPELIAKLQAVQNPTERAALASQLFGRGWRELGPMLAMSSGEMDKARKRAHELGLVMSGDALNSAAKFEKQWNEMKEQMGALWRQVGADLLPGLQSMCAAFKDAWPEIKKCVEWMAKMGSAYIVGSILTLKLAFQNLWKAVLLLLGPLGVMIIFLTSLKDLAKIREEMKKMREESNQSVAGPDEPEAPDTGDLDKATAKIMEMNREVHLNGDETQAAAMQWATLNGEFAKVPEETKATLTGLAAQVDALHANAEAAKEATAAWKELGHQMFSAVQTAARDRLAAMKAEGAEVLNIIREQLREQQEARDRAIEEAKSKYEKLGQLGKDAAYRMTNIAVFQPKNEVPKELTPGMLTNGMIDQAKDIWERQNANKAAMSDMVNKRLFGDSMGTLEAVANAKETQYAAQEVGLLRKLVEVSGRQLAAIQGLSRAPVRS